MAELSLLQIVERLAIHQDDYGEKGSEAIQRLIESNGVSDFLWHVRTDADLLFRNEPLMKTMADLLQQGFDERRLADYDLFVNPMGLPSNGTGNEIYVLFPDPTNRFINHPSHSEGHYYGQGQVCGDKGKVWLHGAMRADMAGKARLHLFDQSRAVCGGSASVELFDQSRVNPRDEAIVRLHDFSSAFAMSAGSSCGLLADGYSHLIVEEGKHHIELSHDVLFVDLTESDVSVSDRCSGYKPKGELLQDKTACGLVWRDSDMFMEVDFRNRIQSRRCAAPELNRPVTLSPKRINQAKKFLKKYGEKASLPEEYHLILNHVYSMESLAILLSAYLENLLDNGLPMDEVKQLFRPSELWGAHIYTGTNVVPSDLKGRYHVFDHLIVNQTNEKAFGIFHDRAIGIIKAGFANSDGMALIQGEGTALLNAYDHSTMLLRGQAKGLAQGMSLSYAMDHSMLTAMDYSIAHAYGNAVVNGKGHSLIKLHENAVGCFSDSAGFVANDHSRYTLADNAKDVAVNGKDGSMPTAFNGNSIVPTVSEWESRSFYTSCLQERGEALGAELLQKEPKKRQMGR